MMIKGRQEYIEAISRKASLPPKEKDDATEKEQEESIQPIYDEGKFKELAGAGGSGWHAAGECIDIKTALTIKCDVCGFSFYPMQDDHYISREEETNGAITAITNKEVNLYDTFDCPQCGCQKIVARRLRKCEERKEHKNEEVDS